MGNDARTTITGRPPANTQTRVRRNSAQALVLATTQALGLCQEWVWSALRQLRALCSNQWLFSTHLSQPLSSSPSQLCIHTTNHALACPRMTSQEVWASTSLTTITSLAICLTRSRPRNMLASEGAADEVVPVEVVETKCLVDIIVLPVEPTLQGHLLVGHQQGMWSTIRAATILEVDLAGLSLDLKM